MAAVHGVDVSGAGRVDGTRYTRIVDSLGGSVARAGTHLSRVNATSRRDFQDACADAETIVRRSHQVANFVFDSTGSAPEPHFEFFFETGIIEVTRGEGSDREILALAFHELDFDPATAAAEKEGFIGACQKAIRVAKVLNIAEPSAVAYDGTNRVEIDKITPLENQGFDKVVPHNGLATLQALVPNGLKECKTALQASLFMSSIRTTVIMVKEYLSAFDNLILRYEGRVADLEHQIDGARRASDRSAVTRLTRELSHVKKQLSKVKTEKSKVENLDTLAIYHTAFMQAKMKAEVITSGRSLSLSDLKEYKTELRTRIMRDTSVSRRKKTGWYQRGEEDTPGSEEARVRYADSVSGMLVASMDDKRELGCPQETTLEEALITQANASVLTSNTNGARGAEQAGLASGIFKDLGGDIDRFMMDAARNGQKIATMAAGNLCEFKESGQTLTMVDDSGVVKVQDASGRKLGIEEGRSKIAKQLDWVLTGKVFGATHKTARIESHTRSMAEMRRAHFGRKAPSEAYKRGLGEEAAAAEGSIPALYVPKPPRSRGRRLERSHLRGLSSRGSSRSSQASSVTSRRSRSPSVDSAGSMVSAAVGGGAHGERNVATDTCTNADQFEGFAAKLVGPGDYFHYQVWSFTGTSAAMSSVKFTYEQYQQGERLVADDVDGIRLVRGTLSRDASVRSNPPVDAASMGATDGNNVHPGGWVTSTLDADAAAEKLISSGQYFTYRTSGEYGIAAGRFTYEDKLAGRVCRFNSAGNGEVA